MSTKQILKQARAALDAGDLDACLSLCRDVIKSDRKNYRAYVLAGAAASQKGEAARAKQAYNKAIALRPELPVAWKGLLELSRRFPPPADDAEGRLLVIRAHKKLAEVVPDQAGSHLLAVARLRSALAEDTKSAEHVSAAVVAWREIPEDEVPSDVNVKATVVRLFALKLPEIPEDQLEVDGEMKEESGKAVGKKKLSSRDVLELMQVRSDMLMSGELSDALDRCEDIADPFVVSLLSERIQSRAREGILDSLSAFSALRELSCFEQQLELMEEDQFCSLPASLQLEVASEALDTSSRAKMKAESRGDISTRSSAVLAAYEPDIDRARSMAGIDLALAGKAPPIGNITVAFVRACLHLKTREHKAAILAAERGSVLCSRSAFRRTYKTADAVFSLLRGLACQALHEHEQAVEALKSCTAMDGELSRYAYQVLAEVLVSLRGRESEGTRRVVSDMMHKDIPYGALELAWSGVLSEEEGAIDKLKSAVDLCVKDADGESTEAKEVLWFSTVVGRLTGMAGFSRKTAALAMTRLGQAQLALGLLDEAKSTLMRAASFLPGYAAPFFFLGYLFEVIAHSAKDGDADNVRGVARTDNKAIARAIRCYEKGLKLESNSPLGSRRLARIFVETGDRDSAVGVARDSIARNPLASWAWNIIGWAHLERKRFQEASSSFQSALRTPETPAKSDLQQDELYGTYLGRACTGNKGFASRVGNDSEILIKIDSWRGLALAYRQLGRFSASLASIEQAIALCSSSGTCPTALQRNTLIHEKALGLLLLKRPLETIDTLSALTNTTANEPESEIPAVEVSETSQYILGEAYLTHSDTLWARGAYRQATEFREKAHDSFYSCAAKLLENETRLSGSHDREDNDQPPSAASIALKRSGDAALAALTFCPGLLARLVGTERCAKNRRNALRSYQKAASCRRNTDDRLLKDIALVKLLDEAPPEDLKEMMESLNESGTSLESLATGLASLNYPHAGLLTLLEASASETRYRGDTQSPSALKEALSVVYRTGGDLDRAGAWATKALEDGNMNPKSWMTIGMVREAKSRAEVDQRNVGTKLMSAIEAYKEAERLGGGLEACECVARCLERLVTTNQNYQSRALLAEAMIWSLRAGRSLSENLEELISAAREKYCAEAIQAVEEWSEEAKPLASALMKWPNARSIRELAEQTEEENGLSAEFSKKDMETP